MLNLTFFPPVSFIVVTIYKSARRAVHLGSQRQIWFPLPLSYRFFSLTLSSNIWEMLFFPYFIALTKALRTNMHRKALARGLKRIDSTVRIVTDRNNWLTATAIDCSFLQFNDLKTRLSTRTATKFLFARSLSRSCLSHSLSYSLCSVLGLSPWLFVCISCLLYCSTVLILNRNELVGIGTAKQ